VAPCSLNTTFDDQWSATGHSHFTAEERASVNLRLGRWTFPVVEEQRKLSYSWWELDGDFWVIKSLA